MTTLRIGDAERDATVELLNRHFAEGRLTKLEHEERTTSALTATTQRDLDALLADLPHPQRSGRSPVRRPWPAPWAAFGLVRLALLAMVAVFIAVHVVPVLALLALCFLVSRLVFGWHRPWDSRGRRGARW
jgi:hypothetical protein